MRKKVSLFDFVLQRNKKLILIKCLNDEELMNAPGLRKLALKRIINFIITQYNHLQYLHNIYSSENDDFILALILRNRISLFSKSFKNNIKLQIEGYDNILRGAMKFSEKRELEFTSLSFKTKFKFIICSLHIAEVLWDSSKVFPPQMKYYEISEIAEDIFFRVFDHIFEVFEFQDRELS